MSIDRCMMRELNSAINRHHQCCLLKGFWAMPPLSQVFVYTHFKIFPRTKYAREKVKRYLKNQSYKLAKLENL